MKKYLVNFSTKEFYNSQKILNKSALKFGVDKIISYNMEDIKKTDLYKKNKNMLDQKRGGGYWLWKPYIILKTLEKINDEDILIYADSGIEIIDNLDPLFKILQQKTDILTFITNGYDVYLNKYLTKRDCFVLMNCDSKKYWDAEMRDASFHLYKKTTKSINFLKEWLKYAEDERIITDKENTQGYKNLDGFIDHRHDQSIFSLLAEKQDIEKFRDPSQWGNYLKLPKYREFGEFISKQYSNSPYLNSLYGTLTDHHRRRNISFYKEIIRKIRKILKKKLPKFLVNKIINKNEK